MDYKYIWTIKELYEWACEHHVENYSAFGYDEGGMECNIVMSEDAINRKNEEVYISN